MSAGKIICQTFPCDGVTLNMVIHEGRGRGSENRRVGELVRDRDRTGTGLSSGDMGLGYRVISTQ